MSSPSTQKVLSIEQAINICLNPKFASNNFLPAILTVIVSKLNLGGTTFEIAEDVLGDQDLNNYQEPEIYEKVENGIKKPIRLQPENEKKSPENNLHVHIKKVHFVSQQYLKKSGFSNTTHPDNYILLSGDTTKGRTEMFVESDVEYKMNLMDERINKVASEIDRITEQYEQVVSVTALGVTSATAIASPPIPKDNVAKEENTIHQGSVEEADAVRIQCDKNTQNLLNKISLLEKSCDNLRSYILEKNDNLNITLSCLNEKTCDMQRKITRIESHMEDVEKCTKHNNKKLAEIRKDFEESANSVKNNDQRLDECLKWKKTTSRDLERITELIEFLKIIKADREEMDYLFNEKSNRSDLEKYMTNEKFQISYEKLKSLLTDTINKVTCNRNKIIEERKKIDALENCKVEKSEMVDVKKLIVCKIEAVLENMDSAIENKLRELENKQLQYPVSGFCRQSKATAKPPIKMINKSRTQNVSPVKGLEDQKVTGLGLNAVQNEIHESCQTNHP